MLNKISPKGETVTDQRAKAHKVNKRTAKKILVEIPHENSDIVEVGVVYESAKKSTKNPLGNKSIN